MKFYLPKAKSQTDVRVRLEKAIKEKHRFYLSEELFEFLFADAFWFFLAKQKEHIILNKFYVLLYQDKRT